MKEKTDATYLVELILSSLYSNNLSIQKRRKYKIKICTHNTMSPFNHHVLYHARVCLRKEKTMPQEKLHFLTSKENITSHLTTI